jgi:hypothetical protein
VLLLEYLPSSAASIFLHPTILSLICCKYLPSSAVNTVPSLSGYTFPSSVVNNFPSSAGINSSSSAVNTVPSSAGNTFPSFEGIPSLHLQKYLPFICRYLPFICS